MPRKKKNIQEHTHKYQRIIMGGRRVTMKEGKRYLEKCAGYEVFKCVFPGCTHYVPTELAVGREVLCWNCDEKLILNSENTTLKRPTHVWCRKVRGKLA